MRNGGKHLQKKICIGAIIVMLLCFYIETGYDSLPVEEDKKPILTNDNIIDLGNHIIAYRTSSAKEINSWAEGNYIVICALDRDCENVFLFPDIYEEIYDLRMEGTDSIYISYGDTEKANMYSVHIPMRFPSQMDYIVSKSDYGKIIVGAQEDIEESVSKLPELVWDEKITWGGKEYNIMFERVSLVYSMEPKRKDGLCADYCLTVESGKDNIIFQQMIINYPVIYEMAYWLTDFSGDGFPDIAFCISHYVERSNWTEEVFMIWNMENAAYEPKPLPKTWISRPMWNDRYSSVICVNEEEPRSLNMFTFYNGDWELTGQLLPVYEEDENGYLVNRFYKEIFYNNGKVIEENIIIPTTTGSDIWYDILFDKEIFWSSYNEDNMVLYPNIQGWEELEVTMDGINMEKYVKKSEIALEKTNEYGSDTE